MKPAGRSCAQSSIFRCVFCAAISSSPPPLGTCHVCDCPACLVTRCQRSEDPRPNTHAVWSVSRVRTVVTLSIPRSVMAAHPPGPDCPPASRPETRRRLSGCACRVLRHQPAVRRAGTGHDLEQHFGSSSRPGRLTLWVRPRDAPAAAGHHRNPPGARPHRHDHSCCRNQPARRHGRTTAPTCCGWLPGTGSGTVIRGPGTWHTSP